MPPIYIMLCELNMPTEQVLIDAATMSLFEQRADELIFSKDIEALKSFCSSIEQPNCVFDDDYLEVRYLYTLGNCYSEIYKYR